MIVYEGNWLTGSPDATWQHRIDMAHAPAVGDIVELLANGADAPALAVKVQGRRWSHDSRLVVTLTGIVNHPDETLLHVWSLGPHNPERREAQRTDPGGKWIAWWPEDDQFGTLAEQLTAAGWSREL